VVARRKCKRKFVAPELWNAFSEESGKAGLEIPAGEAGLGRKTVNIARQ